jgi:hypothetical protein
MITVRNVVSAAAVFARNVRFGAAIWWATVLIVPMTLFGAATAEAQADLGVLQPFYRSTQLQGHLIALHLIEIPAYLLGSDIDFPYRRKPGAAQEIPFVDRFTINRFLGGYKEDWVRKSGLWDDKLGIRSMDYVVRSADGSLKYRPDLIELRLKPYLDVGYRPQDITIALENVPSDIARTPEFGAWGDRAPPADLHTWSDVISHFASDLKTYLGNGASAVSFKTGVEYDQKESFDGTPEDFFALYEATERGLHAVLPGAALSAGEFTRGGECPASQTNCVYDTADFLRWANSHRLAVSDVPRSLNSFNGKGNPSPSAAVERAVQSYARLPAGTIAEIHQFGLLDQPFGVGNGDDPAAAQASWQFQALMGLWQQLHPRRVFHWGGILQMGKMEFLNGAGFLRLILDHYNGAHGYLLHAEAAGSINATARTEILAVAFTGIGKPAVIVSSFNPAMSDGKQVVRVTLPRGLSASSVRTIHYRASDNVFMSIRTDLASDGNLKSEFISCPLCLAPPINMAANLDRAREMIPRNYPAYETKMNETLRWHSGDTEVSVQGSTLSAKLEANELLVVELD